jgi:hypothetical protein
LHGAPSPAVLGRFGIWARPPTTSLEKGDGLASCSGWRRLLRKNNSPQAFPFLDSDPSMSLTARRSTPLNRDPHIAHLQTPSLLVIDAMALQTRLPSTWTTFIHPGQAMAFFDLCVRVRQLSIISFLLCSTSAIRVITCEWDGSSGCWLYLTIYLPLRSLQP